MKFLFFVFLLLKVFVVSFCFVLISLLTPFIFVFLFWQSWLFWILHMGSLQPHGM